MMFLQIAAATLVSVSSSVSPAAVSAPAIPDAPIAATQVKTAIKKHNFNKFDYSLYAGVVAYRVGDYVSTESALARGQHEVELPAALVANKPGFAAYSLGLAALEIGSSVYLHKHGHAKLARIADVISITTGGATDIHNAMAPTYVAPVTKK